MPCLHAVGTEKSTKSLVMPSLDASVVTQCHPRVHPANRLPREAARLWDYFLKRAEVMHRWDYIVKRSEDHPLVQLVEVCLSEEASCRPSADEVLQQLEAFLQAPCEYLTELDDLLREVR